MEFDECMEAGRQICTVAQMVDVSAWVIVGLWTVQLLTAARAQVAKVLGGLGAKSPVLAPPGEEATKGPDSEP